MAKKISELTPTTTPQDTDEVAINRSGVSYRIARSSYLSDHATTADLTAHTGNTNNPHSVTKAQVGLGNVDNTSDSAKPVSTATQTALNGKANTVHTHTAADVTDFTTATDARITAQKGAANGLATLDSGSKVPSSQLPSYVDDVLEFTNLSGFPGTGTAGIIYVALDTNKTYRWSGSGYVEISASPGSTDSVPEGSTNKYFTDARVSANADVAANTSARHTHANKTLLDTYDQTNANLTDAVSKKHASTLVGTKTIDETNIANGRVPAYNATSGKLEYVDQTGGTGGGATNLTTTQSPTSVTLNSDTGTDATISAADTTNAGVMSAADKTKLNGIATAATANSTDATLLNRANHTGTQSADTLTDGTTNKAYTASEKTKLAGIAPGATANDTDANLKNRANHTGTQTLSTISDAGTAASKNVAATGDATATQVVLGNDSRLSDARTPTAHVHAESDVTGLTADLAAKVPTTRTVAGHDLSADVTVSGADLSMSDVTTNNVSTSAHGFAPKAPNDATKYLDGTGAWSVPAGGGGGGSATPQIVISDAFTKALDTQQGTLNLANTASKGFTFDGIGMVSAFSSSFYATARRRTNTSNAKNFFSGNSTFAYGSRDVSSNLASAGSYAHVIMGDYDIGSATTPSYTTVQHYGFKYSRVGGVFTSSYTNGDGTSDTSASFSMSNASSILFAQKTGTTNIKYYENGTLLGTVTTHLPTTMTNYLWSASFSNPSAGSGAFAVEFVTITKDAY